MRKPVRWVLLIGFCSLFGVTASEGQDAKKDKRPDYYPLQVGNSWTYRMTANGKSSTFSTRLSKTETIKEQLLARLETPPPVISVEHLFQNDAGVHRARANDLEISPPVLLVPAAAKVGHKWSGAYAVEKEQGKFTYRGEIQKEESIEVPAGKYTALRVQLSTERNGATVQTTYWFAPEVGIVKQATDSVGVSSLLELEKFTPGTAPKK